jgi:hypothetical protein
MKGLLLFTMKKFLFFLASTCPMPERRNPVTVSWGVTQGFRKSAAARRQKDTRTSSPMIATRDSSLRILSLSLRAMAGSTRGLRPKKYSLKIKAIIHEIWRPSFVQRPEGPSVAASLPSGSPAPSQGGLLAFAPSAPPTALGHLYNGGNFEAERRCQEILLRPWGDLTHSRSSLMYQDSRLIKYKHGWERLEPVRPVRVQIPQLRV